MTSFMVMGDHHQLGWGPTATAKDQLKVGSILPKEMDDQVLPIGGAWVLPWGPMGCCGCTYHLRNGWIFVDLTEIISIMRDLTM